MIDAFSGVNNIFLWRYVDGTFEKYQVGYTRKFFNTVENWQVLYRIIVFNDQIFFPDDENISCSVRLAGMAGALWYDVEYIFE